MPAPLVSLCNAIVADLNSNALAFPAPFEAVRGYIPRYELPEIEDRRLVVVVPGGTRIDDADRGHVKDTLRVGIGVLRRLPWEAGDSTADKEDLSHLDAELAFMHALRAYFMPDDQSRYTLDDPMVQCLSVQNDPAYDHEKLHEIRQFTSVLEIEFEEVRG